MDEKKNLPDFYVVLVEPKHSGNIGAVARVMMNFDFDNLYLVNPCPLDDECYARAMHADTLLDHAHLFTSFTEAVQNLDYLIATSSIESKTDKKHLRKSVTVEDFTDKIGDVTGKIGLIFGREDFGLYNEEIAQCDMLIKIPTSDAYLSLNLSHSVSILLYSLYIKKKCSPKKKRPLGRIEKEKLFEFFSYLLEEINYPEHKKENTKIMFRRIMGRALPSKWEYHTMMGIFSKTLENLRHTKKNKH
jgi:TrmH family RNA methyltransferase